MVLVVPVSAGGSIVKSLANVSRCIARLQFVVEFVSQLLTEKHSYFYKFCAISQFGHVDETQLYTSPTDTS